MEAAQGRIERPGAASDILPFLGCFCIIARPKVTPFVCKVMAKADAADKAVAGVSTADELAKLQQLKDAGTITQAEYDSLEAKTLAGPDRAPVR